MKVLFTENAPKAIGPYSQGYISHGLAFLSGQGGIDPATGALVSGGVEAQAEQAIKNIDAILKIAGSDHSKVIKTTVFLADMKDFQAFNKIYEAYFTGKPARTCVAVKELPANFLCEIEVIAEADETYSY